MTSRAPVLTPVSSGSLNRERVTPLRSDHEARREAANARLWNIWVIHSGSLACQQWTCVLAATILRYGNDGEELEVRYHCVVHRRRVATMSSQVYRSPKHCCAESRECLVKSRAVGPTAQYNRCLVEPAGSRKHRVVTQLEWVLTVSLCNRIPQRAFQTS